MKKLWMGALSAMVIASAGIAIAQEAPKPGPETRKLDVFAGKWKGEATMKAGPWGPGGTMTSEQTCSWFAGGFVLECHEDSSGDLGKMKSEAALGWSPEDKVYKYMGFDSMGMMLSATGTVSGNTWNWTGEDRMGGKLIKSKYTVVVNSPTSQSFKWQTSDDGGKTWTTAAEGKSTKR